MLTNAGQHRGSATQNLILTPLARAVGVNSFHEKAGVSQDSFVFTYVDFSVMSDFRSLQGGRTQFTMCCYPDYRPLSDLFDRIWARS